MLYHAYKKYVSIIAFMLFTHSALALDELNVAYFLEWPSANQIAQLEKTYDERLGLKVNWRSFDNGNAMTAAMISGDIDIAYSQGFSPFVNGVTRGADLKLVGIAMTYSENDNCVVNPELGVTQANAKDTLKGKKIGTPVGNVTHYKLLKMLDHLGVNKNDVTILSMSNADASAAFARGNIDVGCGFGGALRRMLKKGSVIMTGAEQEAIGLEVFDIVSVSGKFAKKYPEVITQFMQITEDANLNYNRYPERFYDTLSKASGMSKDDTIATLKLFTFPNRSEQLSDNWMLGGIQRKIKETADFFKQQKVMSKSLSQEKYDKAVDASFLAKVK